MIHHSVQNYDKNTLKASVSLRDFATTVLGLPHKHKTNSQKGPQDIYFAPDRTERTPSFFVYDSFFMDFGTGESGDIFTFAQKYAGAPNFQAAKRMVAAFAGYNPDGSTPTPVKKQQPTAQKPDAVPTWRAKSDDLLLDYLTHPEAVAAWQRYKPLRHETIERFNLGYGKLPNHKTSRLIVPIINNGEMVGIRGRLPVDYQKPLWMPNDPAKWMNAKGTHAQLYNADALRNATDKILAICANNIDALLLMQEYPSIDGRELVAISPTSGEATWRDEWTRAIAEAKPHVVVLFYDHDDTGKKAAQRVEKALTKSGVYVVQWEWPQTLPQKTDLGDLITAEIEQRQVPIEPATALQNLAHPTITGTSLYQFMRKAVQAPPTLYEQRYVSDIFENNAPLPRVITIKSPINTGKTYWLRDIISQNDVERVLAISHRSSLNHNFTDRFSDLGFVSHLDLETKDYRHAERLVVTANSLHHLAHNGELPVYDVIIIDESEQVVKHILGGTFKGYESQIALSILDGLMVNAKHIISVDAHLSELTYRLLESVANRHDIHKIVNIYRHTDLAPAIIYNNEAKIQLELEKDLADSKRVFVVSNSRGKVQTLAKKYDKQYRVFDIHSGNSQQPDRQHFLNNINEEVERYDIVIASPTIASGIDIQTPFERVYAIYDNHDAMTAEEMLQQIGRARNVTDSIRIYHPADPENAKRLTDAEQIETEAIETWNQHYNLVEQDWSTGRLADLHPERLTSLQKRHLEIWATSTAKDNQQLIAPVATLAALLTDVGYEVTFDVDETEKPDKDKLAREKKLRKENKDVREGMKEERKQQILTAEPVTSEQYQAFSNNGKNTVELEAGYQRWRIEQLYQQPISENLFNEYQEYGDAILELVNLGTDNEVLAEQDSADIDLAVSRQPYRLLRKKLILWILSGLFKPDQTRGFDSSWTEGIVFTERSLREPDGFWERIMAHKVLIRTVLGLNPDNYTYSTSFVSNLLKKIGLSLKRQRVKYIVRRGEDKGKEKSYSEYQLDIERLEFVNGLLQKRADSLGESWDVRDVIIPSKKTRLILPRPASEKGKQPKGRAGPMGNYPLYK